MVVDDPLPFPLPHEARMRLSNVTATTDPTVPGLTTPDLDAPFDGISMVR
jgi:hypothetical protein